MRKMPLVCSACDMSFTSKEAIKEHILKIHYNLARVNDKRPLTPKEMRSALRLASFALDIFTCREPGCNVSYLAFMSFYTHIQHCGPLASLFSKGKKPVKSVETRGRKPLSSPRYWDMQAAKANAAAKAKPAAKAESLDGDGPSTRAAVSKRRLLCSSLDTEEQIAKAKPTAKSATKAKPADKVELAGEAKPEDRAEPSTSSLVSKRRRLGSSLSTDKQVANAKPADKALPGKGAELFARAAVLKRRRLGSSLSMDKQVANAKPADKALPAKGAELFTRAAVLKRRLLCSSLNMDEQVSKAMPVAKAKPADKAEPTDWAEPSTSDGVLKRRLLGRKVLCSSINMDMQSAKAEPADGGEPSSSAAVLKRLLGRSPNIDKQVAKAQPMAKVKFAGKALPTHEAEPADEAETTHTEPANKAELADGDKPMDEAEPTSDAELADESEPTDGALPTPKAEGTDEAELVDEAEPTGGALSTHDADKAELVNEAEPTDGAKHADKALPMHEAGPTDGAEFTDGALSTHEAEPENGALSTHDAEPADEAEPTDRAEQAHKALPAHKAELVDVEFTNNTEPTGRAESTGGTELADEAEPTDRALPTHEADLAEAGSTDGALPADEVEPTDRGLPSREAEPADEAESIEEAWPTDEAKPADGALPTHEAELVDEAGQADGAEKPGDKFLCRGKNPGVCTGQARAKRCRDHQTVAPSPTEPKRKINLDYPDRENDTAKAPKRSSSALKAVASFPGLEGMAEDKAGEDTYSKKSNSSQEYDDAAYSHSSDKEEKRLRPEASHMSSEEATHVLYKAWRGKFEDPPDPYEDSVEPALVAEWTRLFEQQTFIKCPNKVCKRRFQTVLGLEFHYKRCIQEKWFRCLNCSAGTFASANSMLEHLRLCYSERPEEDIWKSPKQSPSPAVTFWLPIIPYLGSDTLLPKLHRRMCHLQSNVQCWDEVLYPELMPRDWNLVDAEALEAYLPLFRESPAIRCSSQEQQDWQRLPLFGCLEANGGCHVTFYPGGAIWASAWCPRPPLHHGKISANSEVPSHEEWVALACCPDPDRQHPLTDATSKSGLLQIWNLGSLRLNEMPCPDNVAPQLALCLAHDFGLVTHLEWCPSGCWQVGEDNSPRRLGLLALACGDGYARVLSIPVADDLQTPEGRHPVYTGGGCHARLSIPPGPLGTVPCTRVAWDVARGHRRIAAGFADGQVGIFYLGEQPSPLLASGEPVWVWQAHQGCVIGLGWTLQGHLCTSFTDNTAQVWDMDRLGIVPVSIYKQYPHRQLAMSPHWDLSFFFGEEPVENRAANVMFSECCYFGFPSRGSTSHNAPVAEVSVSPWSNVEASCDAAGLVSSIMLPPIVRNSEALKYHMSGRLPLYLALPVLLEEGAEADSSHDAEERSALTGPTHCYSHAQEHFGISYLDTCLDLEGSALDESAERVSSQNDSFSRGSNLYPLNSVNTVCWSPNYTSASWLVSAGQAGLARLSYFGHYGRRMAKNLNIS